MLKNIIKAVAKRGGYTIVMERLSQGLRDRGAAVDIDLSGEADLTPVVGLGGADLGFEAVERGRRQRAAHDPWGSEEMS